MWIIMICLLLGALLVLVSGASALLLDLVIAIAGIYALYRLMYKLVSKKK